MFLYVKKKKKIYKVERKLQCVRATLSCGVLLLLLFFFFITFSAVPKNKMPIKMYSSRNERFITYGRLLPCFYCIFFFFVFLDYNVSFFFFQIQFDKKTEEVSSVPGLFRIIHQPIYTYGSKSTDAIQTTTYFSPAHFRRHW